MKRPRFSIRTMLVTTGCIALLIAHTVMPTLRAKQFERAIVNGNIYRALAMLDSSVPESNRSLLEQVCIELLVDKCLVPKLPHLDDSSLVDLIVGRRSVWITSRGQSHQFIVSAWSIVQGGSGPAR